VAQLGGIVAAKIGGDTRPSSALLGLERGTGVTAPVDLQEPAASLFEYVGLAGHDLHRAERHVDGGGCPDIHPEKAALDHPEDLERFPCSDRLRPTAAEGPPNSRSEILH
jgi:hypothetical protein